MKIIEQTPTKLILRKNGYLAVAMILGIFFAILALLYWEILLSRGKNV